MYILITGTSTSGKTTIVNKFNRKYKKIHVDDYWDKGYAKAYSKLRNDYYDQDSLERLYYLETRKVMAKDIKKYKNVIIDDIDPLIINFLPDDTKRVLIYTNLKNLTRNLIRRRKTEPRKKFVYQQFAENYIKTDNPEESIDQVNINDFIKQLNRVKWNFNSDEELNIFAKDIFKMMGIKDKKTHHITVRENIYDIVINTNKKTPDIIQKEIIQEFK
jgi:hypothetical protein